VDPLLGTSELRNTNRVSPRVREGIPQNKIIGKSLDISTLAIAVSRMPIVQHALQLVLYWQLNLQRPDSMILLKHWNLKTWKKKLTLRISTSGSYPYAFLFPQVHPYPLCCHGTPTKESKNQHCEYGWQANRCSHTASHISMMLRRKLHNNKFKITVTWVLGTPKQTEQASVLPSSSVPQFSTIKQQSAQNFRQGVTERSVSIE
jgi:hypothetical protein